MAFIGHHRIEFDVLPFGFAVNLHRQGLSIGVPAFEWMELGESLGRRVPLVVARHDSSVFVTLAIVALHAPLSTVLAVHAALYLVFPWVFYIRSENGLKAIFRSDRSEGVPPND
ncbi:hypothetical protein [Deinococcus yavapaiensis]|uniref:hypothetical protein n=1 Tax=Deinococcus yavapaiensis TaxID=309889 RepID=UPI0011B82FA2|nr:hypothetical protein [Deinococcus yavapaiensis]